jgi:glycerol uptake facilitator-like aquaporin
MSLIRKAAAEFIGTGVFVSAIVGVTFPANVSALAGLVLAVALGLMVLLTSDTSGGHLNPAVTLFFAVKKAISWSTAAAYIVAQILGAIVGGWVGGLLHGRNLWTVNSASIQNGQIFSEIFATAGLVWLIGYLVSRDRGNIVPVVVTAWIFTAGYFTGSGAVANPAVTIGRMFTADSVAAIGVEQGLYFILAQVAGVLVAILGLMYITPLVTKKGKKK